MTMYRYSMPRLNPIPIVIALLPSLLQFRLCGRVLRVLLRACSSFAGELGINMTFLRGWERAGEDVQIPLGQRQGSPDKRLHRL